MNAIAPPQWTWSLLVASLSLGGCSTPATNAPADAASGVAPIPTGSGVVVHPDGLVLTALHVVDGAGDVFVRLPDGTQPVAEVIAENRASDLALLRLQQRTPAYLPIAPLGTLHLGEEVFTIGFPAVGVLGANAKFNEGAISAMTGLEKMPGTLQVSVPIQPGNSGGPLVDLKGRLVGIILSSADAENFLEATGALPQNVNWAIRATFAESLFDAPTTPQPAADRREAIERAVSAACLIVAWPKEGATPAP